MILKVLIANAQIELAHETIQSVNRVILKNSYFQKRDFCFCLARVLWFLSTLACLCIRNNIPQKHANSLPTITVSFSIILVNSQSQNKLNIVSGCLQLFAVLIATTIPNIDNIQLFILIPLDSWYHLTVTLFYNRRRLIACWQWQCSYARFINIYPCWVSLSIRSIDSDLFPQTYSSPCTVKEGTHFPKTNWVIHGY